MSFNNKSRTPFENPFDTPYKSTYRCQLCEEEFYGCSTNRVTDEELIEDHTNNKRKHMCKDGSIGVALLIGYRFTDIKCNT